MVSSSRYYSQSRTRWISSIFYGGHICKFVQSNFSSFQGLSCMGMQGLFSQVVKANSIGILLVIHIGDKCNQLRHALNMLNLSSYCILIPSINLSLHEGSDASRSLFNPGTTRTSHKHLEFTSLFSVTTHQGSILLFTVMCIKAVILRILAYLQTQRTFPQHKSWQLFQSSKKNQGMDPKEFDASSWTIGIHVHLSSFYLTQSLTYFVLGPPQLTESDS